MKKLLLSAAIAALCSTSANAEIRVGILHSLSGTMAISETTLKDTIDDGEETGQWGESWFRGQAVADG